MTTTYFAVQFLIIYKLFEKACNSSIGSFNLIHLKLNAPVSKRQHRYLKSLLKTTRSLLGILLHPFLIDVLPQQKLPTNKQKQLRVFKIFLLLFKTSWDKKNKTDERPSLPHKITFSPPIFFAPGEDEL